MFRNFGLVFSMKNVHLPTVAVSKAKKAQQHPNEHRKN
jgi:hypothetical protein